ncbi:hypothetical protein B0H14DRAFT_3474907 [Mycena olivaceomarginata]|nr:hypothetical protein B0H14DRAFT_3474907 [Mycena olivaceomarginata]
MVFWAQNSGGSSLLPRTEASYPTSAGTAEVRLHSVTVAFEPPPTACRRLSWVRRLVPPNNDLLGAISMFQCRPERIGRRYNYCTAASHLAAPPWLALHSGARCVAFLQVGLT